MRVVSAVKTYKNETGQYWRIVAVSEEELTKYDLTGADIDGMADESLIDAGSVIVSPSVVYMAFENGHFTATSISGGGGGGGTSGVSSFNGRKGAVIPVAGDYGASQIATTETEVTVQTALDNLQAAVASKAGDDELTALAAAVSQEVETLTNGLNSKVGMADFLALENAVDLKASKSDLKALETEVGQKADASQIATLQSRVTALEAVLTRYSQTSLSMQGEGEAQMSEKAVLGRDVPTVVAYSNYVSTWVQRNAISIASYELKRGSFFDQTTMDSVPAIVFTVNTKTGMPAPSPALSVGDNLLLDMDGYKLGVTVKKADIRASKQEYTFGPIRIEW